MTTTPLFRPVLQRGKHDCAIAVLAALTGRTYKEVLAVAIRISPTALQSGLYSTQMVEVAGEFGVMLKRRTKNIDLDEHSGILELEQRTKDKKGVPLQHVVLLTNGLIFDPQDQGNVWDAETYMKVEKAKVVGLLEEVS